MQSILRKGGEPPAVPIPRSTNLAQVDARAVATTNPQAFLYFFVEQVAPQSDACDEPGMGGRTGA
jgi:hypothetical protein